MTKIYSPHDLGLIVKNTRKSQNLTQQQLALICGVGIRFISDLEQGKESCHLGKTLHILSMLGISIIAGEQN